MCCWFSTLHLAFQHPKIRKWNACTSIASWTFSGDHFHPESPLHSPNWLQKCQRQGSWSMCFTADFSMCGSALPIICWQSFSSKKEEISTTSGCRLPELSQILEVTHCTRTEKSIFQEVSKKMYVYINILYIYIIYSWWFIFLMLLDLVDLWYIWHMYLHFADFHGKCR